MDLVRFATTPRPHVPQLFGQNNELSDIYSLQRIWGLTFHSGLCDSTCRAPRRLGTIDAEEVRQATSAAWLSPYHDPNFG